MLASKGESWCALVSPSREFLRTEQWYLGNLSAGVWGPEELKRQWVLSEILGCSVPVNIGCWETKNVCQPVLLSQVPRSVSDLMQLALLGLYLNFSCLLEFHWKFCLQWFSISQSCWKEGLNLLGMWMCCSCQLLNLAFQIKLKNCTSSSVLHFDYLYKSNLPILFYLNFVHPHV